MRDTLQQRPVPRLFLLLSLCFGLGYAIITPPFAASDELEHFARAYALSVGSLRLQSHAEGNSVQIPATFSAYAEHYGAVIQGIHDRAQLREIARDLTARTPPAEAVSVPVSHTRAGVIAYAPQLPALWLARTLGLPALWSLYLARFASVLAFALLAYWALSLVNALSWGWLAFALTPALLAQAAAASAEGTTIGLSFLFFALVFRGSFLAGPALSPRQCAALFAVFALLAACNPVCLIFVLSLPAVRWRDDQTTRQRLGHVLAAFVLGVAATLALRFIAEGASCLRLDPRSAAQLSWLVGHPLAASGAFLSGVFHDSTEYVSQLLVVRDLLSKQMRFSTGLIATFYIQLLLFLTLGALHGKRELAAGAKEATAWLSATVIAFVVAVFLNTYVCFNELGAARLRGVHGPLFFAAAPAASIVLASVGRPIAQRWLLRRDGARVRYAVIAVHVLCLIVLFGRYYAAPTWPYLFH